MIFYGHAFDSFFLLFISPDDNATYNRRTFIFILTNEIISATAKIIETPKKKLKNGESREKHAQITRVKCVYHL